MELRLNEIDELMASPSVAVDTARLISLSRERASLEPVVNSYKEYLEIQLSLEDTQSIIREADDPDFVALAKEEVASLEDKRSVLEKDLKQALIPTDPSDTRNVFVEIRAATGGDEASLFAGDLYRMYSRYAQLQRWQVDLVDTHESEVGGFKEIISQTNGRATVAVLPEAEEVDIDIKDEDLRIDIFHAGGHGGQNVNKVATAVRVTHLATGIAAVCQDERSQLRNKEKALNVLRARLLTKHNENSKKALARKGGASAKTPAISSGYREFYGLSLEVNPGVFIPRPETEILVDEAMRLAKQTPIRPPLRIVEVGTGCGAIAVALASCLVNVDIHATDISRQALATAQANAEHHGLRNRIEFIHCDLLSCFSGPIDVLIANLPYVRSTAISSLEPEIRMFEPREALDGGDDGLRLIRRLLGEARPVLRGKGVILLEMDPHQMDSVEMVARSHWPSATTSRHKDLAGLDRVLAIQLSGC
ncbi:Peptide chain release factor 1 [Geodia barretti]|uniref:Peptide chain release factor 1 n=1 Tax=Geodia barretti TaxID=519541 RepID=A0AA35X371_GEOBA|nr:Peptide chain release factor 1 [Geodia barretti]